MAQFTNAIGTGRRILDVEYLGLDANTPLTSPLQGTLTDGTNGSVRITPDSITSEQPNPTTRWDLDWLRITAPVMPAGVADPDLELRLVIDNQVYDTVFIVPIDVDANPFPRRENTVGEYIVFIGYSLLAAARKAARGGGTPANYPLAFSGIPIAQSLQVTVTSHAGFSGALEPLQIEGFGDILDQGALSYINRHLGPWVGPKVHIEENSIRRELAGLGPYKADFQLAAAQNAGEGQLSLQNFLSKPSGYQQGFLQVWRFFRYARPKVDVTGNTPFGLTQVVSLAGGSNNVDRTQDLGYQGSGTAGAEIIREFGRRPSPAEPNASLSYDAQYFGITFDGRTVYPDDTALGALASREDNPVWWGTVQPFLSEANKFMAPRKWFNWSPLMNSQGSTEQEVFSNEDAAFTIAPKSGGTISGTNSADTASVNRNQVDTTLVGGYRIVAGGSLIK